MVFVHQAQGSNASIISATQNLTRNRSLGRDDVCPLLAEAVEKLWPEAVFDGCFYNKWTFCSRLRRMPERVFHFWPVLKSFYAWFRPLPTLAPVSPRNLSLVIAMFRFASPNSLSIFLRSRADWL